MKIEFGNVFKITFYALASVAVMVLIVVTVTSGLIAKGMRDAKRAEEAAALKAMAKPSSEHPHGLSKNDFDALFTNDKPIVPEFPLDVRMVSWTTDGEGLHLLFAASNRTERPVLAFRGRWGLENGVGDVLYADEFKSEKEIASHQVLLLDHSHEWCKDVDKLLAANRKLLTFQFVPAMASEEPGRDSVFQKRTQTQTNVMALIK